MKRFFLFSFIFLLSHLTYSQSQRIISTSVGMIHFYQGGFGAQLSYSQQVKDKLYFVSTLNGYSFKEQEGSLIEISGLRYEKIQLDNAASLNVGLRYVVGNDFLKPYCSIYWGLLRRSGSQYSYATIPDERVSYISENIKNDITAVVGFDFGAMLLLNDSLACDINSSTSYGIAGQSISLKVGLAYMF